MATWERAPINPTDSHEPPTIDASAVKSLIDGLQHELSPATLREPTALGPSPIEILGTDDTLRYFVQCSTLEVDGDRLGSPSLLFVTDGYVLVATGSDDRELRTLRTEMAEITTVAVHQDCVRVLRVETTDRTFSIDVSFCRPSRVDEMVTALRQAVKSAAAEPVDTGTSEVAVEIIERLAALRNDGAITDEEFDEKKTRLLKHI